MDFRIYARIHVQYYLNIGLLCHYTSHEFSIQISLGDSVILFYYNLLLR